MYTRNLIFAALGLAAALLTASPALASPLAAREEISSNVYDTRQMSHGSPELGVAARSCHCVHDICLCDP
jgi:hypothetical protein